MPKFPTVTSLVGASAAPNHAPAVKPDKIPSSCNFRAREVFPVAAPIELVTVGTDGAPRANVQAHATIVRRRWLSIRERDSSGELR